MPSPFPGMDPYTEMVGWTDFHANLIVELRSLLIKRVLPKYIPRIRSRTYIETEFPDPDTFLDVEPSKGSDSAPLGNVATAVLEPVLYVESAPDSRWEPFLEICCRETNDVVTVVEVLSPMNKRRGSDGRRTFLEKWRELLSGPANLVEIDLLRRGDRSPTTRALAKTTDYCVMVHRRSKRPVVEVFEWPLARRLPTVPVPLSNRDPDVFVDLQAVFDSIYDGAGYAYYFPYDQPLDPPPCPQDTAWIEKCLAAIGRDG